MYNQKKIYTTETKNLKSKIIWGMIFISSVGISMSIIFMGDPSSSSVPILIATFSLLNFIEAIGESTAIMILKI